MWYNFYDGKGSAAKITSKERNHEMILADKIISLRKKCGWSQEELAEKLNVSRQSVSKWEGAQSIPDIDKIIVMSEIFGVTTDYLLKDDIEVEEKTSDGEPSAKRKVSIEEANEYLRVNAKTRPYMMIATFLCTISPICLILLSTASEIAKWGISGGVAAGVGLTVLFLFVISAVAMYVACGIKLKPFEYLENEPFETEYGVSGLVKEKKKALASGYIVANIIGISLCIISPLPLIVTALVTENAFAVSVTVGILLLLVAIGVAFLLSVGIPQGAYERLLKEGEYSDAAKDKKLKSEVFGSVYWPIVIALYLGYSFISGDWGRSWIIWPVAGIVFGAIEAILGRKQ